MYKLINGKKVYETSEVDATTSRIEGVAQLAEGMAREASATANAISGTANKALEDAAFAKEIAVSHDEAITEITQAATQSLDKAMEAKAIAEATDTKATAAVATANEALAEAGKVGKVKTVDYIAPDDNGNIALGVATIKSLIPPQASETNQLADKNFVNSSVQTNTANFRGNWATWEAVPTEASGYPSDYADSTTPTENDYMVVQDASSYGQAYEGTWRFKYSGNWAEVGKNGWYHEYQVNETPLTAEQLATLNSGLTATNVIKSDGANATSSGVSSMLNQLTEGTSDPQDNDFYIAQYAGGGTEIITYHRRRVKALWNYIKGKISSVLGLTATSYGGTSNKATSVVDYGDTNKSIKIGYAGSELTTVKHLAGYGSDGTTIKKISLSNVKKAMYLPATKYYGGMGGATKYATIQFNRGTPGGILITTGFNSNLWFDANKGAPYAFTTSTEYGVTGYAWSSDGNALYLRFGNYNPITVTIPSFHEIDSIITFGELSSTAPSGVTFRTDVNTIASNAVSYNAQSLTDDQKTQARNNIGAVSAGSIISLDTRLVIFKASYYSAKDTVRDASTLNLTIKKITENTILSGKVSYLIKIASPTYNIYQGTDANFTITFLANMYRVLPAYHASVSIDNGGVGGFEPSIKVTTDHNYQLQVQLNAYNRNGGTSWVKPTFDLLLTLFD